MGLVVAHPGVGQASHVVVILTSSGCYLVERLEGGPENKVEWEEEEEE